MLPPIHRGNNGGSNQPAVGTHSVPGAAAGVIGSAVGSSSDASARSFRPSVLSKEAVDHGDNLHGAPRVLLDKLRALERENESVRDELQHVRRRLSNNQQERDEERLSLSKVVEELQRLALAFNAKFQADATSQQREQQKAALLFAEVARLGQHVGRVDGAMQTLAEDTRRRLQEQQQHMTVASTASLSPIVRHHDLRRQQQLIDDLSRELQQLRLDSEAERGDWRRRLEEHDAVAERARRQLIADVQNRLAADKMEILTRLTDEWRQLMTSTDAKRSAQVSSELSRVNDHFADLERWLQGELNAAKRVVQVLATETDGKLQALAQSVVSAMSATVNAVAASDEDVRVSLMGMQDAVGEVTHRVQKKLVTLEDVLPLEVKARQQGDDKLRRRVDSVMKTVEAARVLTVEAGKQQKNAVASQIERKMDVVRRETEAKTLTAIEELSTRLKEEEKREKAAQGERLRVLLELKADREALVALSIAQDRLREALASVSQSHTSIPVPSTPSRPAELVDSAAIEAVEDKAQQLIGALSDRHNELLGVLQEVERRQLEDGARVDALQGWTTSHAGECRAVYDYVTWSLEASAVDDQVRRVVGGLVERVVDAEVSDRIERLERRGVEVESRGAGSRPSGEEDTELKGEDWGHQGEAEADVKDPEDDNLLDSEDGGGVEAIDLPDENAASGDAGRGESRGGGGIIGGKADGGSSQEAIDGGDEGAAADGDDLVGEPSDAVADLLSPPAVDCFNTEVDRDLSNKSGVVEAQSKPERYGDTTTTYNDDAPLQPSTDDGVFDL